MATACAETGFYVIEVADECVDQAHSEYVETLLSLVEDKAKRHLDAILDGCFPLSDQTKFDLALFVALPVARGWVFRNDLVETRRTRPERLLRQSLRTEFVSSSASEASLPTPKIGRRESAWSPRHGGRMRVVPPTVRRTADAPVRA